MFTDLRSFFRQYEGMTLVATEVGINKIIEVITVLEKFVFYFVSLLLPTLAYPLIPSGSAGESISDGFNNLPGLIF